MNKNIEVINENLWAVNMDYVKMGYIKGMELIPNAQAGQIKMSTSGIIIIDKASKLYPALKRIFPKVMSYKTEELQARFESVQNPEELKGLDDLFFKIVEWEINRRCVKAEYLKSISKPTFKMRILTKIKKRRKEGDISGSSSNRDTIK